MAYFVFDLDQTLAELDSVYYFLMTLKIKNSAPKENNPAYSAWQEATAGILGKLDTAYDTFVKKVLEAEQSTFPLGILRTGILQVMQELDALRDSGQLKSVIIYSNNGRMENLEFVRDLIALSLGRPKDDKLITDLIHWGHPMRKDEHTGPAGSADKTWRVLKSIIDAQHPPTNGAESDFIPENVYFFDDFAVPVTNRSGRPAKQVHKIKAQLKGNYNLVTPYKYNASANRIGAIYSASLEPIINADDMAKFVVLTKSILNTVDGMANGLEPVAKLKLIVKYIIKHSPKADNGYDKMMEAIEKVRAAASAAPAENAPAAAAANGSAGGRRATRRRYPHAAKTRAKKKLKWRP